MPCYKASASERQVEKAVKEQKKEREKGGVAACVYESFDSPMSTSLNNGPWLRRRTQGCSGERALERWGRRGVILECSGANLRIFGEAFRLDESHCASAKPPPHYLI
jgi:hypothetical protein